MKQKPKLSQKVKAQLERKRASTSTFLRNSIIVGAAVGALAVPVALGAASSSTSTSAKESKAAADAALVSSHETVLGLETALAKAKTAEAKSKAADEKAGAVVTNIEAETPVEKPKEEPPKEEPPKGAKVNAAPTGPAVPLSGWHVAYADGFGATIGSATGQDGTWFSDEKYNGCCGNSNEVAVDQHAQARIGPEGLELVCTVGTFTVEKVTRQASCGSLRSDLSAPHPFEYAGTLVGQFAVELVAKWPACSGGADPGWWIYPGSESREVDFFEGWCWPAGSRTATDWAHAEAGIPVMVSEGRHEIYPVTSGLGFDPSLAYHRYTTAFVPEGNGKYDVREYIDGVFRWNVTGQTLTSVYDGLNLTNGLRVNVQNDVFGVRSAALYQDGAHAGQGIKGGGIAPGTTVE